MNVIKRIVLGLMITVSLISGANATVISVNDWWLQSDSLGGLRQSTTNSEYFFAVSKSNIWDPTATYESISGYRIATTAEGLSVFNQNNFSTIFTYYNQGGWSGYTWEGLSRYVFRFSDSNVTNAYKHAGNYDEFRVQYTSQTTNFAGFVMIREQVAVTAPSALLLLLCGASAAFMFSRKRRK